MIVGAWTEFADYGDAKPREKDARLPNTSDTFVRAADVAVRRTGSSVNHPLQLTTGAGPQERHAE